jgi:trehalose 6-phosphate synthase/phosphatase
MGNNGATRATSEGLAPPRLLVVSNRLPVTVTREAGAVKLVGSSGGLATGLRGPHERSGGQWIGWPGDTSSLSAEELVAVEKELALVRAVPVPLTHDEVKGYYNSFSNGVLWPLFHYQLDRIPADAQDWDVYRAVNAKFAAAVAEQYRPGDMVWVHDYQLMLVPALLRRSVPDARIGFFLHIPFPSSDVFRTLPWRDALLEGMLGADLIGFHAFPYVRHFSTSLLRILGLEPRDDGVSVEGRDVRFGVFPMGIDAASFQRFSADVQVREEAEAIRSEAKDQQILVGIDRLDYTKGIPRRLLAFERLLERSPALRGRVRLVQLAVPSRAELEAYAQTRTRLDEIVGRVNGRFGTAVWTPIHYLYRAITPRHVVALYRAADVMLVTPLRDGMNLVAKEFVASRDDEDGVLILSEFAGAAAELGDALLVNPFDIEGVAEAMSTALRMPRGERRSRMATLRRRVLSYDVDRWAQQFLAALADASRPDASRPAPAWGLPRLMRDLVVTAQEPSDLVFLLDYDGTLVPGSSTELAAPDADLLSLLRGLAERADTKVTVVSGRPREVLERWLGALPIGLLAEHGFWSRSAPGAGWVPHGALADEWKRRVRPVLDEFAGRTPGASVEEKSSSLAWHYRFADPEFGRLQARELRVHLANAFSNAPVEVLVGDQAVEIRAQRLGKELVVSSLPIRNGAQVIAMGNDPTDEDIFDALPATAFTIHVGHGSTQAKYRLSNTKQARAVLRSFL